MEIKLEDKDIADSISVESLSVTVTTECNCRCSHCYSRAGLSAMSSLEIDTAFSIVKEGFELGYRVLNISGGEPMLWPHLAELIGEAFKAGYEYIICNTNGTLLSKERCAEFAKYGARLTFFISVQGKRTLHESIRGKGTFKGALKGIENALLSGNKVVVFTSAGKSLIHELAQFTKWMFKHYPGIDSIKLVQLLRVYNDSLDLSAELLSPADFVKLVKTVSFLSLSGYKIEIFENPLANAAADMMNMKWIPDSAPVLRPGRAVITADGNITLFHSSRNSFGKYKYGSLRDILYSQKYKGTVSADCTDCGDCPCIDICARNGIRRPSEWFRDMHPEIFYCKRVMEEIRLMQKQM